MALTYWTDTTTGERLNRVKLDCVRRQARRVYEANSHIFEDELDALAALGIVPLAYVDAIAAA